MPAPLEGLDGECRLPLPSVPGDSLLVLLLAPGQYPFEGALIAVLSARALRDRKLSPAVLADVGYFRHISFSFLRLFLGRYLP